MGGMMGGTEFLGGGFLRGAPAPVLGLGLVAFSALSVFLCSAVLWMDRLG